MLYFHFCSKERRSAMSSKAHSVTGVQSIAIKLGGLK
jgi:hypothetical protein